MNFFCFFFSSRRRHTRWPRDWSSDVCSSDLRERAGEDLARQVLGVARLAEPVEEVTVDAVDVLVVQLGERCAVTAARAVDDVGDRAPCDRSLGCGEGRHVSARDLYRHSFRSLPAPKPRACRSRSCETAGVAPSRWPYQMGGSRVCRRARAVRRTSVPLFGTSRVDQQYFFFANAIQPDRNASGVTPRIAGRFLFGSARSL